MIRFAGVLFALAAMVRADLLPARGQKSRDERKQTASSASSALRDSSHRYQVVIANGWRPVSAPAGTLAAYQDSGGHGTLAITRVEVGVRWAREPEALMADVERGVERATPGFRRMRRKVGQSGGIPMLDLWYERRRPTGPALVLSRFLFFNRHSVVLSIGLEPGAARQERRAAEAMLKSFTPLQVP